MLEQRVRVLASRFGGHSDLPGLRGAALALYRAADASTALSAIAAAVWEVAHGRPVPLDRLVVARRHVPDLPTKAGRDAAWEALGQLLLKVDGWPPQGGCRPLF